MYNANIVTMTETIYDTGNKEVKFDVAARFEYNEEEKSDYSEEAVIKYIPKELLEYATKNFPENFEESSTRYRKGDTTFVFEYTDVNSSYNTFLRNVYLNPTHISIEECTFTTTPNHDSLKINNEWYIIFKDNEYLYVPRSYSIDHYKDNNTINIETNFEGGWNHSFSSMNKIKDSDSVPEGGIKTTVKRYVGSDNREDVVYTDIKLTHKDGKLLSEEKEFNKIEIGDAFSIKSEKTSYYYNE